MAQVNNYKRGRAFEYRTRDKLKKLGAVYVMRAAQSKGIIDLLALWPRMYTAPDGYLHTQPVPWLVQCKFGKGAMRPFEREDLKALGEQTGGIPVLARPKKVGRGIEFLNLATNQVIGGEVGTVSSPRRAVQEDSGLQDRGGVDGN